jgi:hypothetical protein
MSTKIRAVRLHDAKAPMVVVVGMAFAAMALGGLQVRGGEGVAPVAALAVGPRHLAVPLGFVAVLAATVGAVGRWQPDPSVSAPARVLMAGLAASTWFLVAAGVVGAIAAGGLVLAGADPHLTLAEGAAMVAMVARLALSAGALGMLAGAGFARRPGVSAAVIPLVGPVALEAVAAAFSASVEPLFPGGSWAVLAAGDGPTAAVSVSPAVVHGVMVVAWVGLPVLALFIAARPEFGRR